MRHFTIRLLIAFLLVASGQTVAIAQDWGEMPPPPIEVDKIVRKELKETLMLYGNVHAGKAATIRAEVQGAVTAFEKEVGDAVADNEVVCNIDPEKYRIVLDMAESQLTHHEAALEKTKLDEDRVKKLHAKNVVSLEELQQKSLDREMAEADVTLREAEVRRSRRDLRLTTIRAPYDAFIATKYIQKGDWVQSGAPLFDIVSLSTVYATVALPEKDLGSITLHAQASLWLDAYPDMPFTGVITHIAPQASKTSRDFTLRIDFSDERGRARDGLFARAEVVPKTSVVIMAPKDAIVERGQQRSVFVIKDNVAKQVPVEVMSQQGNMVVIEGAVKEGDEVAVTGNEILQDGAKVNVTLRR